MPRVVQEHSAIVLRNAFGKRVITVTDAECCSEEVVYCPSSPSFSFVLAVPLLCLLFLRGTRSLWPGAQSSLLPFYRLCSYRYVR